MSELYKCTDWGCHCQNDDSYLARSESPYLKTPTDKGTDLTPEYVTNDPFCISNALNSTYNEALAAAAKEFTEEMNGTPYYWGSGEDISVKGGFARYIDDTYSEVFVSDKEFTEEMSDTPKSGQTETCTTSATGGQKGVKQARFDLIPSGPLWELAELYGRGAEKYTDRNWEKGYEYSKSFAALMRHAWLFWSGENNDPETGKSHMASIVFHAFALMEFVKTFPDFDDRPNGFNNDDEFGDE